MVAFLALRRKLLSATVGLFALGALAACDASLGSGPLVNTNRPVPVALLVPKSSTSAGTLAQSLENAARLAASDLQSVQIDLRVYDTIGTAEGAALAASQAVGDGARIIVGPLFGEAAAAAGQAVASSGVNILTFSNNPAIAGGNVFLLGNTFQTSADRLVRYAAAQGKGDIYIVHADDPAENLGRDAIQRAIVGNGANRAGTSDRGGSVAPHAGRSEDARLETGRGHQRHGSCRARQYRRGRRAGDVRFHCRLRLRLWCEA